MFPPGDDEASREKRALAFRDAQRAYVEARAAFTSVDATLRDKLKQYVEASTPSERWSHFLDKEKPRVARLTREKPVEGVPELAQARALAAQASEAWGRAVRARAVLVEGMKTRPYPEAGVGISGVVSLAWPDLGIAFSRQRPVIDLLVEHLPVTLMMNLLAFPIIYLVAIPSGMLAAVRRGTWADVGLGGVYIALYSVPVVLAGALALGFLATPQYANIFPTAGLSSTAAEGMTFLPSRDAEGWERGWLLDRAWHLFLPVLCIVYTGFAVLSKQTRAAMLENLNADYVRTAKAKGVANNDVIFVHVFRNSLLPLITMFVTIFPAMLAGSVVIEKIFSVQGMGFLLLDAISQRDRELILANTTIIAVVNLLALLIADILYAMADPRIAYK
jgi:peptide/nickel transport system permease protein